MIPKNLGNIKTRGNFVDDNFYKKSTTTRRPQPQTNVDEVKVKTKCDLDVLVRKLFFFSYVGGNPACTHRKSRERMQEIPNAFIQEKYSSPSHQPERRANVW